MYGYLLPNIITVYIYIIKEVSKYIQINIKNY